MHEVLKTQQSENLCLSEEFGRKPVPKTHTKEMTERISNSNHPGSWLFCFFAAMKACALKRFFVPPEPPTHSWKSYPLNGCHHESHGKMRLSHPKHHQRRVTFRWVSPPHSSAAHPKETRIRADLGGFWGGGWTNTFKKNMLVNMASSSPVFGEKIPQKQLNKTYEETATTT